MSKLYSRKYKSLVKSLGELRLLTDIIGCSSTPGVFFDNWGENLKNAIGTISSREQEILKLYYGLDGNVCRTYKEVGEIILPNISTERVRQIITKSLRKLKHPIRRGILLGYSYAESRDKFVNNLIYSLHLNKTSNL